MCFAKILTSEWIATTVTSLQKNWYEILKIESNLLWVHEMLNEESETPLLQQGLIIGKSQALKNWAIAGFNLIADNFFLIASSLKYFDVNLLINELIL